MPGSKYSALTLLLLSIALLCCQPAKETPDLSPNLVVPTPQQLTYQQMEFVGFIHFTMNTFTDKEWGFGDEDPDLFNPTELDTEQWARVAKEAGMKELILTAKHHDGFCLWPSEYTEHSIKNSPYKNGKGDIVKAFVEACRKEGLKVGLYLSPWDRNHPDYGKPGYLDYYRNQLRELLTNYGEINEIWFDGANGGDGYYGGANEVRTIDRNTYYDWPTTIELVKTLQPDIKIFSDAGPDIRWVGNEHGHAGETFWSTIQSDSLVIGASNPAYLNTGAPDGDSWIIGQCDVSIRPGWFYHQHQDSLVKSADQIMDIYYKSVGRNGVLLLNLPPDQRGLIHEKDITALQEFRKLRDDVFSSPIETGITVSASQTRGNDEKYGTGNLLDGDLSTYWTVDDDVKSAELEISFDREHTISHIELQEPIALGQRTSSFELLVKNENDWQTVFQGTTIGYKRIIKIDPVRTSSLKILIKAATNTPALAEIKIY